MNLTRRIQEARELTPAEHQIGRTVLAMGERLQTLSIKEFARIANVSIASVHRFCKKIGLEGYKELKVELARLAAAREGEAGKVDFNFPFGPGEPATRIVSQMHSLYRAALSDTCDVLDPSELQHAATLVGNARTVGIYTQSHNLYPAQMFCDRLLSIGHDAFCHRGLERQFRAALAAQRDDVAVVISYSGLSPDLVTRLSILAEQHVPVVFIGTPAARQRHPGLATYLLVGDREDLQERITQLASHISVQFVLDALFGCIASADYDASVAFLERSLPYTHLPVPAATP